jgi:hypothetical protein
VVSNLSNEDTLRRLGKLIAPGEDVARDAVHIAVAPVSSPARLVPGQHVRFVPGRTDQVVGGKGHKVGIVDPLLGRPVEPGERFWLWLYPGSITSLRHDWTHAADAAAPAEEDG